MSGKGRVKTQYGFIGFGGAAAAAAARQTDGEKSVLPETEKLLKSLSKVGCLVMSRVSYFFLSFFFKKIKKNRKTPPPRSRRFNGWWSR
jgi:hypothetical protein